MHRSLKRLAAWPAHDLTVLLALLLALDLAFFLPSAIAGTKPSLRTRVWTLVAAFYRGLDEHGPEECRTRFEYVLLHGQWTDTARSAEAKALSFQLPHHSPDRVHIQLHPRSAAIGVLAPSILWTPRVQAVYMLWFANLDDARIVPEPIQTAVLRAHAADQYGDPALARHLPHGGASRLMPLALGVVHDPVFVATLTLIVVRCRHNRAISRLNSLRAWRTHPPTCPRCNYDRTSLTHLPCPECGWGAR